MPMLKLGVEDIRLFMFNEIEILMISIISYKKSIYMICLPIARIYI